MVSVDVKHHVYLLEAGVGVGGSPGDNGSEFIAVYCHTYLSCSPHLEVFRIRLQVPLGDGEGGGGEGEDKKGGKRKRGTKKKQGRKKRY